MQQRVKGLKGESASRTSITCQEHSIRSNEFPCLLHYLNADWAGLCSKRASNPSVSSCAISLKRVENSGIIHFITTEFDLNKLRYGKENTRNMFFFVLRSCCTLPWRRLSAYVVLIGRNWRRAEGEKRKKKWSQMTFSFPLGWMEYEWTPTAGNHLYYNSLRLVKHITETPLYTYIQDWIIRRTLNFEVIV